MLMSAGLVGAIVVLIAGPPGLRKTLLSLLKREFASALRRERAIWQYSRQSYSQAEIYKSRLVDAIATLTKGSNSLTDPPRESSRMQSASDEAVGAPVALRGLGSPVTGDLRSAQVKADNFELKIDLGAESVLAGPPEPAAPAHAMASPARFTVEIAAGTSSTLTPIRRPHRNLLIVILDRATSPPPNGTPIVPASSAAIQGLPATEAPKPATEREPEPAAPAQATASPVQSAVGTADGTSSTPTTPVAAPPSQSPDLSLDRATAPGPDRTPIALISSAADQGLAATEAPKPTTAREPEPAGPHAGDCQLIAVPCRDRGRNVIDAHHRRCGANSATAIS